MNAAPATREPIDTLRMLLLVRGVAFGLAGVAVIVFPSVMTPVLVPLLAGLLGLDGFLAVVAALMSPAMPRRRGIALLHGLVALALAGFALASPVAGISFLLVLLGAWIALAGLLHVALGLAAGKSISAGAWWIAGLAMVAAASSAVLLPGDASLAGLLLLPASAAIGIGAVSAWIALTPKRFLPGARS